MASFSELKDKMAGATLAAVAWCGTMDLLAMATTERTVAIHRLNWQRIYAPIELDGGDATSLDWSPDGAILCAALDSGDVLLLSAETGKVVGRMSPHGSRPVRGAVFGAQHEANVQQSHGEWRADSARHALPALWELPAAGVGASDIDGGRKVESTEQRPWGETKPLTVLVTTGADDSVVFSAFGLLPFARFDANSDSRLAKTGVAAALGAEVAVGSGLEWALIRLVDHDAICFLENSLGGERETIHRIACLLLDIGHAKEHILAGLEMSRERWTQGVKQFHQKLDKLDELVAVHEGANTSAADVLHGFMLSGEMSDALVQWFTSHMPMVDVVRLHRSLSTLCADVKDILVEHLARAAVLFNQLANVAHGLALVGTRGLAVDVMTRVRATAAGLKAKLGEYASVVDEAARHYDDLLIWLVSACSQVTNEEPPADAVPMRTLEFQRIADLLSNNMARSLVSQYLVNAQDLETPIVSVPAAGSGLVADVGTRSLSSVVQSAVAAVDAAREHFTTSFSSCLAAGAILHVGKMDWVTFFRAQDNTAFAVVARTDDKDGSLTLIRRKSPTDVAVAKIGAFVHHADGGEATTYAVPVAARDNNGALLVLYRNRADDRQAVLVEYDEDDLAEQVWHEIDVGSDVERLEDFCARLDSPGIAAERVRVHTKAVVSGLEVSPARGLACIVAEPRRVFVLDLQEDEDEDEESDSDMDEDEE